MSRPQAVSKPAESHPTVAVIVVAAGSGTRLGHAEPKAFVELRGMPILEHALNGVFDAVETHPVHATGRSGDTIGRARTS